MLLKSHFLIMEIASTTEISVDTLAIAFAALAHWQRPNNRTGNLPLREHLWNMIFEHSSSGVPVSPILNLTSLGEIIDVFFFEL